MRLLLDEMYAPVIAATLSEEGWDVLAVAWTIGLRGLADQDLLAYATREKRLLVTENIVDFAVLHRIWTSDGRVHAGLVYTNPRRFNRAASAYPGNLLSALRTFLSDPPPLGPSGTWWL